MKRGEIYYANLSPAVGSEMNKRSPVLIVSNDANNRATDTVTILSITSNVTRDRLLASRSDRTCPKKHDRHPWTTGSTGRTVKFL